MKSSIKKLMVCSILVATLLCCNQESTLQSYYVDNELKPGFTSVDVPISMLKIEKESLTEDQKEAYESVEKLSMIAFVLDENNQDAYNEEFIKVKTILKNPKYQELIRGGNVTDGKFVVNFIGEEESVEEFVLLGSANDKGFAVIRVLGDDMNLNKIMTLSSVLKTMDLEEGQLKEFTEFFN